MVGLIFSPTIRACFRGVEWLFGLIFLMVSFCMILLTQGTRIKGKIGEHRVFLTLRNGLDGNYRILNDIYLPLSDGTTTQIDHVVVSAFGIFVIETKNYTGWIFASEKSSVWTQTIYRVKNKFQNPLRQNYRHVCTLSELTGVPKSFFHGIVVFTGNCEFKTELPKNVVYLGNMIDAIRANNTRGIKESQIDEVASAIAEWGGSVSRLQRARHVANLRKRLLRRGRDRAVK